MGFFNKAKEIITGRMEEERERDREARRMMAEEERERLEALREEVRIASQQAQRDQAIRLAVEREKIKTDNKLRQLRQPQQTGFFAGMSSYYPKPKTRRVYIRKKGKKKKGKKRYISYPRIKSQRIDLLGIGSNQRRYRVI